MSFRIVTRSVIFDCSACDSIHQRAIFRKLIDKYDIWLEASWPTVYHDMPIHFIDSGKELRTQTKNRNRQKNMFEKFIPSMARRIRIHYTPEKVREEKSVLGAMLKSLGLSRTDADFSLPILPAWNESAEKLISSWNTSKPILLYRPLVKRTEWGGCDNRNPDFDAYRDLFQSIRDNFFVVSIADLVPDVEWMVSHEISADVEYHNGELNFETIAALVSKCALVYASPGFAVPLALAVKTPVICVFGGYENSCSFSMANSPYLGIDTIKPCMCFSHTHECEKRIDVPAAKEKIRRFLDAHVAKGTN